MSGRKVVVIDDDPMIRFLVQEYLTALGHTVSVFDQGRTALDNLLALMPDIVVLDMQMPEMNGLEVLSEIRARAELNNMPVLLLSANAAELKAAAGLRAAAGLKAEDNIRADCYLEKPFQMDTLLEAVQSTQRGR